jgi:hypothetical protein
MAQRNSLSKKLRFEVFKRDDFTCSYCGKSPPQTILEIDHIDPVSEGGNSDINNLTTSCFDCNRGKGKIKLNRIAPGIKENLELLKLKEEQLSEYRKYVKLIQKRVIKDINEVNKVFQNYYPEYKFSDSFRTSVRNFLKTLPVDIVCENMETSCLKVNDDPGYATKYFCRVCWNQIKGENSVE